MAHRLLGLPLEDAIRRLRAMGVEPAVIVSRAPRRTEGVGALRVVRVRADGAELTVSAFVDRVREGGA